MATDDAARPFEGTEHGAGERLRAALRGLDDAVLDALPAHIAVLDGGGTIVAVNAAWQRFAAAGPGFGVGLNYLDVARGARGDFAEEGESAAAGIRSVLEGAAGHFELEYPCHSPSEERWFRLMVAPLRGEPPRGVVVMHVDVTERRRAEDELRRSEERFRAMIEHGSDVISLHDAGGHMTYQSPSIRRVLGYEPAEIVGHHVLDYIHPDQKRETEDAISGVRSAPGLHPPFVTRFRHKDGSWRWFECVGSNQLANPAVGRIIFNARDITERRQLEERLRQAQKMEAVGRLAGGVAHDFNNLLTAINGYSDLILGQLAEDEPLRRRIEEIRKAGGRAGALTHQLLAFSRQQILQPQTLNLNEIVTDVAQMLRRLIGEDIELAAALDEHIGKVEADPGQIVQVIVNLAVNARDAMPQGGKLTVETHNAVIDQEYAARHVPVQPGRYVVLAVSDSGTGMDAETQQHIFEPFFTTKGPGRGTGMGLATVYGIVKQSGGYIWVYSELGRGTTFKIYLPRADQDAAAVASEPAVAEMPTGSERILLVEDEDLVRNLTREILEMCGYEVLEASNGVEAIRLCETTGCEVDLVITDVVMPNMGGRELTSRLAEMRPALVVLYTSGYTDRAVVHHGILEPGINFIQKPYTPDALAQKVREVLDASKRPR